MYEWRVSIPSRERELTLTLDERLACNQLYSSYNSNVKLTILAWCSLLADSPVDPLKPRRVITKFFYELVNDFYGVVSRFSTLYDRLTRAFAHDGQGDLVCIDDLFREFRETPIFREYHNLMNSRDPRVFKYISTFLVIGKKVYVDNPELDTNALCDWLKIEDDMIEELPTFVDNLRQIIYFVVETFTDDHVLPKHGSGAVSERGIRGTVEKNINMPQDERTSYLFRNSVFHSYDDGDSPFPCSDFTARGSATNREARLKFVPKTWSKRRSICMEPISNQYWQQAVRLWVEASLEDGVLNRHVRLSDQTLNQVDARIGSKDSTLDTIDLSSASDRVPWVLVKALFPAKVLKYLAGTRSSRVLLPDGTIRLVKKFAPMGSSLCFPIQTILYSAVCILAGICQKHTISPDELSIKTPGDAKRLYFESFRTSRNYMPKQLRLFRAYGDDIITDYRMTSNVVDLLGRLGFKVNVDKTFTGKVAFRESCGGFYLNGEDVTPLTLKAKQIKERADLQVLGGVIDTANLSLDFGYIHLRKVLVQFAMKYPVYGVPMRAGVNPVLFTDEKDTSFAIRTIKAPSNSHLRSRRFDVDSKEETSCQLLQRDEVCSISVTPSDVVRMSEKFDNYRYNQWWRSRYRSSGTCDEESQATPKADMLRPALKWRWTPAS